MKVENGSFDRLYTNHYKKFVRFAYNFVRDSATAEDIVSNAILYYWENRARLPDDTNIEAYLLTVIKNKCLDQLRHIRMKEKALSEMFTNAQWDLNMRITTLSALEPTELYAEEIYDKVNKALLKLPEKTQLIFRQNRFENLPNKVIAENLGISVKTVEAHITNALKWLRQELKDYFLLLFLLFF